MNFCIKLVKKTLLNGLWAHQGTTTITKIPNLKGLPNWYRNSCAYLISGLRLSFSQVRISDGAHLWPRCGQFWCSKAPTIHLEGCRVHWKGFQMGRLKKSPKISETGRNDVFRPKNATLPTVRQNQKSTFFYWLISISRPRAIIWQVARFR